MIRNSRAGCNKLPKRMAPVHVAGSWWRCRVCGGMAPPSARICCGVAKDQGDRLQKIKEADNG